MKSATALSFALLLSSAVFAEPSPSLTQHAVAPQIVEVPSGALRLKGYLWKPAAPGPFPAVLFNHGSGADDAQHTAGRTMAEAFEQSAFRFIVEPKMPPMLLHHFDFRSVADYLPLCTWRRRTLELFRDIVILMRDTGMRNQRELYRMRIEKLDWENRVISVPDSKTPEGRRLVPMSRRVFELLRARCGTRTEGWVFPSRRAASGHLRSIDRLFREARQQAGLSKELVLYCARHDYGTRVLMRTGNLAAVMKTMGHRDVKTAMHYQHPELEVVRAALDYGVPNDIVEKRV
jgi:integrase